MKRPRSSLVGLGDAGLSLYSANKLRKLSSEFDSVRRNQARGTAMALSAIGNIADLQMATMSGIRRLQGDIGDLAKISSNIADHLERKERMEEKLGDLKLIMIKIEEELDKIDEYSQDYPEYSTLQVESIQSIINENGIILENFKTLPPDDIKWAKSVLDRIDNTHSMLMRKLS